MTPEATSALATITCELRGLESLHAAMQSTLGDPFTQAVEAMGKASGRVIVTGVGKSGHIARKIAATLASIGKPAQFVHPADASHGDLGMIRSEDIVYALSWSGESAEFADIITYTRRFAVPLIAATGNAASTLGKAADVVLTLPACEEASTDLLAPTTTTTMQLVLGDAIAIALLARGSFSTEDFRTLHPGGRLATRLLRVQSLMHTGEEVPAIPDSSTLAEAIVHMTGKRFGITAVISKEGKLIGAITDGDLRRAFASGFHDRSAREVMGHTPRTAHPSELATAALARMNAESITSLFVVENDLIVGILHIHDLLRAGLL